MDITWGMMLEKNSYVANTKSLPATADDNWALSLVEASHDLVCLCHDGLITFVNAAGLRHSSVIVVNAERDIAGINHCLLEELTQSLGLPNDSIKMRPSIFSDKDQLFELSPVDKMMIRVLYDKRMKMGVLRKAGLTMARQIFSDIVFKLEKPATSRKPQK